MVPDPPARDVAGGTVRLWRVPEWPGMLLMHGTTPSYAVQPTGEYFVGVIGAPGARLVRGRRRHDVAPGQLVAWDPSGPHRGFALDGGQWECRLVMIEPEGLAAAAEEDRGSLDPVFPDPVVRDPGLAADLLALHRASLAPASSLARQAVLTEWLGRLIRHAPLATRDAEAVGLARTDPALRRACELLADDPAANVTLDELARVAGVGKFRLVRLFRAGLGMPPHRFQLAHRVRLARRLLERGTDVAAAAAGAGFCDQSHLHRHFRRALGLTPAGYAAAFRKNVQDTARRAG